MSETEPIPPRTPFSIHKRLKSFAFAFCGLRYLVASEHNAWLHGIATASVLALGVGLGLNVQGWCWIVLAIGWVWMAETFNTAIERLADRITIERDPQIKIIKDLAAAGVLISALGAAAIGLLVFGQRLFDLL